MDLEFKVTNQIMERIDTNQVVGDSKNYLYASFEFSSDWQGLDKIAQFTPAPMPYETPVTYNVALINDRCLVPWEVLTDKGNVQVNVFAGDRITVNPVTFNVLASGIRDGELPNEPTPGYFQQVLDQVASAITEHNVSPAAHDDIRQAVATLPTDSDVSGEISTHNTSPVAHNDIRQAVAALPTDSDVSGEISTHNTSPVAHDDIRTNLNLVQSFQSENVYFGELTKSTGDASGVQSISGVGFKPKSVIVLAVVPGGVGRMSIGLFANGTGKGIFDAHNILANTWNIFSGAVLIRQGSSSSNQYLGVITATNDDGFDITWTKGSSALTENVNVYFLAFR